MKTKENSIIATTVDLKTRTLTFEVSNGLEGASRKQIGTLVLDLTKVSESNRDYAAFHGFKQRIADKAAIGQFAKDGITRVTPQMKLEAMSGLVDFYNSGSDEWSPVRSGDRIGSDELMLARALAELHPGKPVEEIRAAVSGWTKQQRTALMLKPEIKVIVDRMTAEAVSGVDTEELLSGF